MKLSGTGFRAGSEVKIVFDDPAHVTVGSVVTKPDGTFRASVVVPRAGAGAHKLQVVGTSASGQPASLAKPVLVLASRVVGRPARSGTSLAGPVLLTVAVLFPLVTWLALEILGWRRRHFGKRTG
ncbi:MAG: hypothetical protein ACRDZX_03105 [Acidimicrobiales bacterium]